MRIQPKYILLVSDAIIPLLGLFVFEWSLYFILLFYLLDLVAREVLTHFKTREIYRVQGLKSKRKWRLLGIRSGILLLLVITAIHGAVGFLQPGINFWQDARAFWEYEEFGIQQGYILVPLIAYGSYAQYRMSFLMTGKARSVLLDTLWKQHIIALLLILAGALIGGLIGYFVAVPDALTVCTIVLCSGLYSYFLDKV